MEKFLFATQLTLSYSSDEENAVGKIRTEENKEYRFVKNADAAVALALGDVAFHKISEGVTMVNNVYQALTANLSVMAGVCVATDGIAITKYGYVQISGTNASISVSGATTGGTAITAGDYLMGVNAANYLKRDAATQPLYTRNVQTLAAVATTTTPAAALIAGRINCR